MDDASELTDVFLELGISSTKDSFNLIMLP